MKTNQLIVLFILVLWSSFTIGQTTVIPDANFEDYLETHAVDGSVVDVGDNTSMGDGIANNGLVLTNRIDVVSLLDISNQGIFNLSGIEDFAALETLFCNNNNLSTLDVSNNLNLVSLVCGSNNLTSLDVSSNTDLETFDCSENQIEILDVSSNLALKNLTASGNRISAIDVSNNAELSVLNVSDNRIEGELMIANNSNLERLFCASNQITTLNLLSNNLLRSLDASNNAITDLDLSAINTIVCPDPQTDPITVCQGQASINVSRNQLSSLALANTYNDLISIFDASDNPDLFCILVDNGFTPSGWIKDDWTYYSATNCVDIYTYIPDDNFEQALIDQNYDDILDNLVLTTSINGITSLDISNASISSLVGIEDFLALEILDVNTNAITSLDLLNNTALLELDISSNDISSLDLSSNAFLTNLNCEGNVLDALDLSSNTALTVLNCSNNSLSNLDVSTAILLADLDCSYNQIERLDLNLNTALTSVLCNDNNLFSLDVKNGNNGSIVTFVATNNANLFCIEVDNVAFANGAAGWQKDVGAAYNLDCGTYIPDDNFEQALIDLNIDTDGTLNNFVATTDIDALITLDISALSIADLTGIEDFQALQDLNVSNNMLSSIDLSSNAALEILDCSMNQIEALDLSTNMALTSLLCNYNALTTLNVENGNNAMLAVFSTTENPNLFCINVDDAIIGNIPGSWQKDDFTSYNGDCINNRFTLIPDPFFEQALVDFGYDNGMDGQVLTSNIEHVETLNVSDRNISDLTGIRDFKSLIELDCSGNYLDNLDVSDMMYLERLNCSSNYLLTNDINDTDGLFNTSGTSSLTALYCAGNDLNNLNTSLNTSLEILDCANNDLDDLDVSGNASLRVLNCSNNNLINLDVSNNILLEELNCDNNTISNLMTTTINNATLTSLSCANNNLSNLVVSSYQLLNTLNCASNELSQLNITANVELVALSITDNQISDINLSNNVDLIEAQLSQNNLSQLNVSSNSALEQLNCSFNEITQLDLNTNVLLEFLSCSSNALTTLDLSNAMNLIEADGSSNMLSSIVLSSNLSTLKRLNLSNNVLEGDVNLTTMAISACTYDVNQTVFCPETIIVNLSNNLFDFVNIQNGINGDVATFNATGNPNLSCIQVDDPNSIGVNWTKDDTASYNQDCNFGETYVPDDNFEQALIDLGYDTGPLNDYVLTANIETLIDLDVSGNNIADFTGIEDFLALEVLNCSNNMIDELYLNDNTNLLIIDCSNNALTELDITHNTALTLVNCSNNMISEMDFTTNTALANLNISANTFSSFSPSDVLSLQQLNCDNNSIIELDFQQNQLMSSISCQSNLLETLNIKNGQNAILTSFNAQNNPDLLCIETDNGTIPSGATWLIDATSQFSVECFFGQTYVPDDNFEQALIDLGYDSGVLDDYVLTENIENVSALNISALGITDATGIEDFVSLVALDFNGNSIAMIDLSNNVLLINLDVSNNMLSNLDLSALLNLTAINASSNNLMQIDFGSNLNLIDVDISNNLLTSLNVDVLINLEELNCAGNQLSSLSVTQNPNLTQLFCQSNMFVADQLNLQNGNNENLQIFNATNNPDLGCILVDNPVEVISNTDGIYDNWIKDESASYQTICEDADNDGVPNEDDLCPNTEFGAPVDFTGCAYPDLPNDNFAISITGETCLNSNNGKVTIVAQELYTYTVILSNEDFFQEYNFTNDVDIFNLLAGTYNMCIVIEEWPDYESCYTVVITEPNPLEVFASRMASGQEVSLNMSGSSSYNIKFNDDVFTTHNTAITLELQPGVNTLKVSTDLDCQGIYEERIVMTDDFIVHPNPFKNVIHIFNGIEGENINVTVHSILGQLVIDKTISNEGTAMRLDTSNLSDGVYVMTVKTESTIATYKIIKK